jgi:hypothetical protein
MGKATIKPEQSWGISMGLGYPLETGYQHIFTYAFRALLLTVVDRNRSYVNGETNC